MNAALKETEFTVRSFAELLAAARALTPDDVEQVADLLGECHALSPIRCEQVLREIKKATGIGLGTLHDELKQSRDAKPEIDHLAMARMTIEEIGRENIISAEAHVWRWRTTGVWAIVDDRTIKQAVQGRLARLPETDVNASTVNGVTDVLKTEIHSQGHEFNVGNPEAVNCLNGQIELIAGHWQLKPHQREDFRTTQIPVTFDPAATAPMFERFLDQVFEPDADREAKRRSVLELIGYTLMSHARHERFVMLLGPGGNGKSVLLSVLYALAGSENVAGVQPSNFENRFQRAHLHMKLANIVTELRQGEVIADAELKAITSGEPATVEHKHKDPFVMRPFATCWFGTNHMPHTRDFSEALFRRATILKFERTFAPHEQDPLLKEKLLTELPGILNLALSAYARALRSGFTAPASSEDAKRDWRLEADQVAMFVDDACERDPHFSTPTGEVFNAYKAWASNNGISKTVSLRAMRDRLTNLGFDARRSNKSRFVVGLRLSR